MTTEKPKLELLENPPPDSIFDDIASLRKTATLTVARRVVTVNVAIGRPKSNVYFRCHPDPDMAFNASIVVGDDSSDYYFVHPRMLDHPVLARRLRKVTLTVVYSWPGGDISLWPVPFETRIPVWKSARVAFELSQTRWVQMIWNAEKDRRDYDIATAEGNLPEPQWPSDLDIGKLCKLAFADKIIDSERHPYVMQLRGLTE